MSHTLVKILGFSILIPAVAGLIGVRKINPVYYPFLFCIWAGLINEAVSYTLIDQFHMSNAVNTNIYCLVESLLYVWLFKRLGLFRTERFHLLLVIFLCVIWSLENLVVSNLKLFDAYFTIVYSLVIVLMSITMMNRLIIQQVNLLTNSTFLICTALIIYFTTFALNEIFWLRGLNEGESFRVGIYRIMEFINATVNLIFASAILWMHRKQEFIPQL
jgi:hypothetical protein